MTIMNKIEFTSNMVTYYYRNNYANDIDKYFIVERYKDINRILFLDRRNGYSDGSPSGYYLVDGGSTDKNYIFAGIFAYMILVQQTIHELFGDEVQMDYHKCTGWPLISAGMAGPYYSFENMLKEAKLYPESAEVDNYISMLKVVCPIMSQEIKDLLSKQDTSNLDDMAYQRLTTAMNGHIEELLMSINNKNESFVSQLKKTQNSIPSL